jgi:RimJ/RimL family protein N-acetyltransferase
MFARTDRLLLRPSWPEDAGALYAAIADENIVRNLAMAPWPYTAKDAAEFTAQEYDIMHPQFLLFLRTDGAPRLIGGCGIGNHRGSAELGYWISRPYWGLGFATEAARAVVDIAAAVGHDYLMAGHFSDNPASGRVLRKAGFQTTGQTEMRYSNGRGYKAKSIVYSKALSGDVMASSMPMRRPVTLPYDAQMIAA